MGRNGAGKSSLLKLIVGLMEPKKGSIKLNGVTPHALKGKQRRQAIGFVPQEPSDLLYAQSVQDECAQADRDNDLEEGSALALLSRLVPAINPSVHPRDLSEGQRLALALAVVLCTNPTLLVLDEPTRGLDYQAKVLLTSILKNYARTLNFPVILATHDVELVAELADRVIFIADGEIVADGSTIDVLLASPAFAPQVAKVMSPKPWLTVRDVIEAIS